MANSNVTDAEARAAYERMIAGANDEPTPAWWHALDDCAAYYLAYANMDLETCREMERKARTKLRAALRVVE
jgi:hypothetical protein